eukprot:m51a1_g5433 putative morn repeat-containing protein 2 (159) ;mRNA; f:162289-163103
MAAPPGTADARAAAAKKRLIKGRKDEPAPVIEKGSGCFSFPNGAKYEGEWQKFGEAMKRHGSGRYAEGDEWYEGEWREDTMHGKGRFHYPDGSEYEGDWNAGKYEGIGKYTFPNGTFYEGEFRDNKMHGSGQFVDAKGDHWRGQFCNNNGPGLTAYDD